MPGFIGFMTPHQCSIFLYYAFNRICGMSLYLKNGWCFFFNSMNWSFYRAQGISIGNKKSSSSFWGSHCCHQKSAYWKEMFLRKGCTDHIVKKKDFSPVPLPRADHSTQVLPKRRFKMWLISRNSWLTDPSRAGCIVHIGPLHIFCRTKISKDSALANLLDLM